MHFYLYPEEQDQGEHGELAKNCAKGAGPNHRVESHWEMVAMQCQDLLMASEVLPRRVSMGQH